MAHITYTDRDALDDGHLVDLLKLGVRVHVNGRPITRMTATLFDLLDRYNPGGTEDRQAGALQAMLGLLLDGLHDTAEPGEATGYLYASPVHHVLGHRPLWLTQSDDGWTVMLPSDY